jgi:hypothetical protein
LNIEAGDPFIRLYDNDGVADTRKWDIRAIGASGSQALEFRTINDANTVFNTRMWISQAGFVGIGTTSPQSRLHVSGGADYNTMFASDSGRSGWVIAVPGTTTAKASGLLLADETFRFGTGNYYHVLMGQDGRTQILNTGGSVATTFTPSGSVGIGTTSPTETLHVVGSSRWGSAANNIVSFADGGGVYMELTGTNSNQRQLRIQGINNAGNRYSSIRLEAGIEEIAFTTAEVERMRIKSNGAVIRQHQPAFLAYSGSGGFTVTANGWYNISNALTIEDYDIGSNYSSGGRFTAPVAGRYFFYAGGYSQIGTSSNGERYAFCARVNDGGLTFIGGGNYAIGDTPLSGYSIVYNLAAGDYVDLWAFSAVGGVWGPGSHRVYWGGYLL